MGSNKKLYGYYPSTKLWLPVRVDENGKVVLSGFPAHKTSHQNGGLDEISVEDLSGLLGDSQTPLVHDLAGSKHDVDTLANLNTKISDANVDDDGDPRDPNAHKTSHQDTGSDEIDVTGLVGLPVGVISNLILLWDYSNGNIPAGWSLYESEDEFIDKCTGGVATEDTASGSEVGAQAFDNSTTTRWSSTDTAFPHWVKYDFGVGVSWAIKKLRYKVYNDDGTRAQVKDFTFQGSNNDVDWDVLLTEVGANIDDWQEFIFTNLTQYRYYKMNVTSTYFELYADTVAIWEIEMMAYETAFIIKD